MQEGGLMFIELNFRGHSFVLTSDEKNFIIGDGMQEYPDSKGVIQRKVRNPAYPSTLEGAINLILTRTIKKSDATTLKMLLTEYREMKKEIYEFFKS